MVPYLRAANVKDGSLDLQDVMSMDFSPGEQRTYALRRGDVLVTEGAGSLVAVGASAVWTGEIDGVVCFQNTLLRLRPRQGNDSRFLMWWARHAHGSGLFASIAGGANIYHLGAEKVRLLPASAPSPREQRSIAGFLDVEVGYLDQMLETKRRVLALLEERIDAEILTLVEQSPLVTGEGSVGSLPVRRLLDKQNRRATPGGQMITAFRDGQVTARSVRRVEGFTEAWTEGSALQGVQRGDVVVHGLDGFAGAIGTSEAGGVCSPIYHVCSVVGGGDSEFYGRMLRLLATTGYLGNFATSTRERAVDFRNWGLFGSIPVPVVDHELQRRIGDRIRALRPLRLLVQRSEQLVLERRQALITAAVTGQIEIPGAAA